MSCVPGLSDAWCPSPGSATGPPAPPAAIGHRLQSSRLSKTCGAGRTVSRSRGHDARPCPCRVARLAGIDMEPSAPKPEVSSITPKRRPPAIPSSRCRSAEPRHPAPAPEAGDWQARRRKHLLQPRPLAARFRLDDSVTISATSSTTSSPRPAPETPPPLRLRPGRRLTRRRAPIAGGGTCASRTAGPTSGCRHSHARAEASRAAPPG